MTLVTGWLVSIAAKPECNPDPSNWALIVLCFQSETADLFFLINYSWCNTYMVLLGIQTWLVRSWGLLSIFAWRRPAVVSCNSVSLESHFPKDLCVHFRFGRLGLQISSSTHFCPFCLLSLLGVAIAQEKCRKLSFPQTPVQQKITLSSRHWYYCIAFHHLGSVCSASILCCVVSSRPVTSLDFTC